MRTLFLAIPLVLAAALIALFAIACGGGSGDTAREISDEELAQMVLALEDFGGPYAAFQAREDYGLLETVEQRAVEEFDSADEAQDLKHFGWVLGYGAEFLDPNINIGEGSSVYTVSSVVDLFEDAEGASGYFNDTLTELSEMAGTTSQGFTIHEVESFGADVGDESAGFDIQGSFKDVDGSTLDIWFSLLFLRHGRLVGAAVFVTLEQRSFEDELKGLASVMDQRITSVLASAAVSDQQAGQTDASGGSSIDLVSAAPLEVLSASAENFQQDVESLRMEMVYTMNIGGFVIDADMEMAFQAPDQMHMTMDITGLGSYEMLMLGTDVYMNMPMQGWMVFSMDDLLADLGVDELGVDAGSFQDVFSEHSFLDYEAIIRSLGGDVEDMGEETVDGDTYRHYRATLDFADLAAAFSDVFSVSDGLSLDEVSGPLTFDVWVDPESILPYSLTVSGEIAFGVASLVFDADMRIFGYNEPVEMPSAPEDAASFADLLGGMFE